MRNNSRFLDYILIAVGLIFICHYFFKDKVNSISDLIEIKGVVNNYTFDEHRGLKSHTYNYYVYLNEYSNCFQIGADLVDGFDKKYFEKEIKMGDSLRIMVSKADYNEIAQGGKVLIFGIEDAQSVYMNAEQSIKDYNSVLTLFFGLIFMIAGLLMLQFYKRKNKINTRVS